MVNTVVHVTDSKGNPIPSIYNEIFVHNCNKLGGLSNNYYMDGVTDAYGNYTIGSSQGLCEFSVTANPQKLHNGKPNPYYQPDYNTAQASSSTTLFSGAYIPIVLLSTTESTNKTCPAGYTYNPTENICIQNTTPNKVLNFSLFDIILIFVMIIILIIAIARVRKR